MFDDLARSVPLIGLAYAIGCIATGYYLVRLRTGSDVRQQGSGSSGATNAMRVLGRGAFAAVFAIDVAKGALAVALARWFDLGTVAVALAGVAVIAGHIWPAQLGFQGGKGVATAFGAALAFDAWIAIAALVIAGIAFVLGIRFVMAGLIGTTLAPIVALAAGRSGETVIGFALMAALVLLGHRRNIAGVLARHESVLRRDRNQPGWDGPAGRGPGKGQDFVTAVSVRARVRGGTEPNYVFRIATEPWEFEQIHRLNYTTFVEEIPQHSPNPDGSLVDKFHAENTYMICLHEDELVGMIAVRGNRPFSLDQKLPNLDELLPPATSICEYRLLSVAPGHRKGRVLCRSDGRGRPVLSGEGYDLALISGTTRQAKLYRHIGFEPFGPLVGTGDAVFQPMYLTLATAERRIIDLLSEPWGPVGQSEASREPAARKPVNSRTARTSTGSAGCQPAARPSPDLSSRAGRLCGRSDLASGRALRRDFHGDEGSAPEVDSGRPGRSADGDRYPGERRRLWPTLVAAGQRCRPVQRRVRRAAHRPRPAVRARLRTGQGAMGRALRSLRRGGCGPAQPAGELALGRPRRDIDRDAQRYP